MKHLVMKKTALCNTRDIVQPIALAGYIQRNDLRYNPETRNELAKKQQKQKRDGETGSRFSAR